VLSGVLSSFQTGTYTVRRRGARTLSLGVSTPGAETTFTADGVVQPLNGQQLSVLPSGMTMHNTRRLWTETELRAKSDTAGPDIVEISGEDYRVYQAQKWTGLDGDHYRALLTTWVGV
jgi:hypothetical protein